ERADAVAGGFAQPEPVEQLFAARASRPPIQACESGEEHEVLGRGEHVVDRCGLAREADASAHLDGCGFDIVAGDANRAAIRAQKRGEDADRGGLACSVDPEQGENLAAFDGEVETREHPVAVEALGESADVDGEWHRISLLCIAETVYDA